MLDQNKDIVMTRAEANRWVIVGVTVMTFFITGFLIGFFPARFRVERLETENAKLLQRNAILKESLRIAELRGAVGLMSHRVDQNDFAAAAKLVNGFFNGLSETIKSTDDQVLGRISKPYLCSAKRSASDCLKLIQPRKKNLAGSTLIFLQSEDSLRVSRCDSVLAAVSAVPSYVIALRGSSTPRPLRLCGAR